MTAPFDYPPSPHVRRHGPQGYSEYTGYRPWLRDEFCFRCVYCLLREAWSRHGSLSIDHFLAAANHSDRVNDYDNLLYACPTCNAAKGNREVPDPSIVLSQLSVRVLEDGSIQADSAAASRLIEHLGLDSAESCEFRMLWIGIFALAARHDSALYHTLMGFPRDLPDLSRLRPPRGNTRPHGLEESWHALKQHGLLPAIY